MLVRALEPQRGLERDARAARRRRSRGSSAPGRAGSARRSASRGEHDGLPLDAPPFELHAAPGPVEVVTGHAHRDHPSRRPPVALRPRGLAAT